MAQQVTGALRSARRADADEVYSVVLTEQCSCCRDPDEKWLIDGQTYAPPMPILSMSARTPFERARSQSPSIRPPVESIEDAREMLADIRRQIAHPIPIDSRLKLPRPYRLITAEEQRTFFTLHPQTNVYDPALEARAAAVPGKFRSAFEHVKGIDSLSPVGFNAKRSLALFSYRRAGGSCVNESWYVLEKKRGRWQQLDWNISGVESCA